MFMFFSTGWLKKVSCCTVSTAYFFEPPCTSCCIIGLSLTYMQRCVNLQRFFIISVEMGLPTFCFDFYFPFITTTVTNHRHNGRPDPEQQWAPFTMPTRQHYVLIGARIPVHIRPIVSFRLDHYNFFSISSAFFGVFRPCKTLQWALFYCTVWRREHDRSTSMCARFQKLVQVCRLRSILHCC